MPPAAFAPRSIPVVQIDADLPAVAPASLSAARLRQAFGQPQASWQPELRAEYRRVEQPPAKAAVLMPLVQRPEVSGLNVLLTQRSSMLRQHSGQIAFPGGRRDAGDIDACDTALREAWEEVGLPREQVEVIGSLPEYATGSGFEITPVVGLVRLPLALRPNAAEVVDVFEVPLAFLMDPAHHRWQQLDTPGGPSRRWLAMPWADPQSGRERFIWGATAGMLRNLYGFLRAQPLPGGVSGDRRS